MRAIVAGKKGEPSTIGRYEIRGELGRGVMGVVYEAWDPVLHRTIALKTVRAIAPSRAEREAWEQRFLTEARASARLSHPGIVIVHDVGRDAESDLLYMALEHLRGETLAEKIASGRPLPWREALRIVGRVADALHHAHLQGVVHRDVKPANIMITTSGEPKILDFGIARLDAGALTMPGDVVGTPLYMSPEQAAGRTLDARSDLFSLGAIAWALLTGRNPFEGPNVAAILARVVHRYPAPPSELVPGIPPEVDEIVSRCMAKAPEDRYPNGRALAEDVEDVLAGRTPRHRKDLPDRSGERTRVSLPPGAEEELPVSGDEASARATAPGGRRRGRGWARLALLAILLAAAGVYFRLHPEDVMLWAALGRGAARTGAAEAIGQLLTRARAAVTNEPTTGAPSPAVSAEALAPASSSSAPPSPEAGASVGPGAEPAPTDQPPETTAGEEHAGSVEMGSNQAPGEVATAAEQPMAGARSLEESGPLPSGPGSSPATPETPSPPATGEPPAGEEAAASPSATPSAPTEKGAVPRRSGPTAFLSIGFEHHLKSGTLEVWVDGRRVARETLDSRVTKKLLLLEARKGSVQQTLRLEPGKHEVRVRVRSGQESKTASSAAVFRAGGTRRLEVQISRLSGKVSLEWK